MSDFVMGAELRLKDNASRQIKTISRSTMEFEREAGKASAQARKWASENNKIKGSLSGIKGLAAGAFTAFGGKKAFDWLVTGNADMETYQNTLNVVMKDTKKAADTMAWAQKFAASTPFEIPQVVEATTRMQAYGLNAQSTLGIVGDMAAVMGKDLMSAVEAVADAQTGELERMKEFGITKTMIEEKAKQMKVQVTNNKGQIVDQKAFNAVLFKIMEERYKGGMAVQSKTWKGMLSNTADFMGSMGRKLGKPIFDKLEKKLGEVMKKTQEWQDSGKMDEWIKGVQENFGKAVDNTKKFMDWGYKLLPMLTTVGAGLLTYKGILWGVQFWTWACESAQKAYNLAMDLNPTYLMIAAIAALIVGIIWLVKNWDKLTKKVNNGAAAKAKDQIVAAHKQSAQDWALGNKTTKKYSLAEVQAAAKSGKYKAQPAGFNPGSFGTSYKPQKVDYNKIVAAEKKQKPTVENNVKQDVKITVNPAPGMDEKAIANSVINQLHSQMKNAFNVGGGNKGALIP